MVRSLLTLLGAVAVTFAVVGWFLGWYQIKTTPGADGHREVNIDFNAPKIAEDLSKSKAKIANMLEKHPGEGVAAPTVPSIPAVLPTPPTSSQGVQPVSATVIVRPSLPTPPAPPGNSWSYPQN